MADDDAEVEGELEVIKSIYAQDWVEVSGGKPSADQRMFAYTLSPLEEDDPNLDVEKLTVRFILPQGYPSRSPPIFESGSTPWWSAEDGDELYAAFDSICTSAPGEPVLFQLIEWLRDRVRTSDAVARYLEHVRHTQLPPEPSHSPAATHGDDPPAEELAQVDVRDGAGDGEAGCDWEAEAGLPQIVSGEPFTIKKSTFQAHVAHVTSVDEVRAVLAALYRSNKIARATHNMYAYRIHDTGRGVWIADCDDDGETAAGSRLAHLLDIQHAENVVYGGIQLGTDRFKHINNVARELLVQQGFVSDNKPAGRGKR